MNISPLAESQNCCCRKPDPADSVVHLPVAPQTVARTRFSPPTPVRSQCLLVPEAMELLDRIMNEKGEGVRMVAITGPGDPLATPDITLETVRQVKKRYPRVKIGLKTIGLGSEKLAGDLARAGVDYVEMQVDGIKADVLAKIYAWVRPGLKTLKINEAVELLVREQRNGVPALKFHNIAVTIVTTLYPELNIDHVVKISSAMLVLGANGISLVPYVPEAGAEVHLNCPAAEVVAAVREKARASLSLVEPLLIGQQGEASDTGLATSPPLPKPHGNRVNVAVVSSNGMEVDLHLGQATRLMIYGPREDGLPCLLETREAPEPGTVDRWGELAKTLHDCFVILAASAGETPRRMLAEEGIKVLITQDVIEGTVDVLYGGGKKGKKGNQ